MANAVYVTGPVGTRLYGGYDIAGPTTTGSITLTYSPTVAGQYTAKAPAYTDPSGIYGFEYRIGAAGAVQAIAGGVDQVVLSGATGDVVYMRCIDNSQARNPSAWLSATVALPFTNPTTLSIVGSGSGEVGTPVNLTLTLDQPATQAFSAAVSVTGTATGPATAAFAIGQTTGVIAITPTGAGSASVAVTNGIGLAVVGSPKTISFANAVAGAAVAARYRSYSTYLFQPVSERTRPAQIAGAGDWWADEYGPNRLYVCYQTGHAWKTPSGDWLDSAWSWQGAAPFATAQAPTSAAGVPLEITMDVLTLITRVQLEERHCAFKLRTLGAPRSLISPLHTDTTKHAYIDVVYSDASTQRLACRVVAADSTSSILPNTALPAIQFPLFTEFEKPKHITTNVFPTSATLHAFIENLQFSGNPTIELQGILVPPLNENPESRYDGLAWKYGAADAGITADPDVLGAHDYLDGRPETDFFVDSAATSTSEFNFDPHIFDPVANPVPNTTKWPHTVHGKWLRNPQDLANVSLLSSAQLAALNIPPLVPGMGAIRVKKDGVFVAPGQAVNNQGTLLCSMWLMFPEPLFGQGVEDLYVRYHEWNNADNIMTAADRPQVSSGGAPRWTDGAGKTGIFGHHQNSYGGNSGSSGGRNGWQMRLLWRLCDAGIIGPLTGAEIRGFHLYDFLSQNPPGHNYGSEKTIQFDRFGQQGGLGGVVHPKQWYCWEHRMRMNTIDKVAGTYQADGVLETWLDDVLVLRITGLVFRTGTANSYPYNASALRPCRDLTATGLWFNEFYGGQSVMTTARDLLRTALVWSRKRIGSMKLKAAPSWLPAPGSAVTFTSGGPILTNKLSDVIPVYTDQWWASGIIKAYSGSKVSRDLGTHGGIVVRGSGHSASNYNGTHAIVSFDNTLQWATLNEATPWFGRNATDATANGTGTTATHPARMDQDYGDALLSVDSVNPERKPHAEHSYAKNDVIPRVDCGVPGGLLFSIFVPAPGHAGVPADGTAVFGASQLPLPSKTATTVGVWRRSGSDLSLGPFRTAMTTTTLSAYTTQRRRSYWHVKGTLGVQMRWWDHYKRRNVVGSSAGVILNDQVNANSGLLLPVPERGLLLGLRVVAGGQLRITWSDITQNDPTTGGTATLSQTIYVGTTYAWRHAFWVPQTKKLYIAKMLTGLGGTLDNTGVLEMAIPAVLTDVWAWTRQAVGGSPIPHTTDDGNWQGLEYVPELGAALMIDYDKTVGTGVTTVTAYRPPGV